VEYASSKRNKKKREGEKGRQRKRDGCATQKGRMANGNVPSTGERGKRHKDWESGDGKGFVLMVKEQGRIGEADVMVEKKKSEMGLLWILVVWLVGWLVKGRGTINGSF